jgi:predicted DNA-binding antitoxin AbrB/MazE fold protein
MTLKVEATYENGILKLAEPLPFREHQKVELTVQPVIQSTAPTLAEAEHAVRLSYGLLGWTGDVETLRRIA